VIKAEYTKEEIIIPSTERSVNSLRQKGYGTLSNRGLILTPHEAFYLLEHKKIRIIDKTTHRQFSPSEFLQISRLLDSNFWTRYLIYRDLRERGYIIKKDYQLDFEVCGRDKPDIPTHIIARVVEGEVETVRGLLGKVDIAKTSNRKLVLAVIDRRSEIIYYLLSEVELK
jgi:tRNA-intron endonuclease